jgi:hypothetical protein
MRAVPVQQLIELFSIQRCHPQAWNDLRELEVITHLLGENVVPD